MKNVLRYAKQFLENEVRVSSNVNEVIRAVLNSLFFIYEKFLHAQKAQKALKAQRRNQAKAQKRK